MKKKLFALSIVAVLLVAFIDVDEKRVVASSNDTWSEKYVVINENTDIDTIYSQQYQDATYKKIIALQKEREYTMDSPLLIANPYGTNTTSVYIYFNTDITLEASYTIETEGHSTFSQVLKNDADTNFTTTHEYLLIGCIPDKTNKMTITLKDSLGNIAATKCWTYDAPSLLSGEEYNSLELTKGTSTATVANGLYTVLGNDETEYDTTRDYIFLYDNDGNIRSEIPIQEYRSQRLLFDKGTMYYSCSYDTIVQMERTGRLSNFYSTGDYDLHHDYNFDEDGNIVVLATLRDSDTKEDRIIKIDLETKEVSEVVDLADLLKDYLDTTTLPKDKTVLDWMHINSIEIIDDSMIISSRETSTIIKIKTIYTKPSIDYMIGSNNFWQESGYTDVLLEQVGDFSLQAGQHCVTYQTEDALEEGQYYLYMYNNNNTCATTQPNYDYSSDPQYQDTGIATKGDTSYYYQYLVDENTRTFTLVNSIPVSYSGYVSSAQSVNENIIIDSGSAFIIYEYDKSNQLIQSLKANGGKWLYRVFKYDYQDFWFN